MYVRESGTPSSPAVVFLHGVGTSGSMWARHMDDLDGFYCLAPDLPGFGQSNALAWKSRDDVTDSIAALIRTRASHGKAHVVGLSLGGSIAHTLLARHSDILERVVIDGCNVLPWWPTGLLKAGVAAVSPFIHTRAVVGIVGKAFNMDDETRADMRRAAPAAFRKGFADANDTPLTRGERNARNPTLFVAGEREMKPPVRASNAALADLMPEAEARYVPGCGHGWFGEQPELHLRMVRNWLTGYELPMELIVETTPWDPKIAGVLKS